MGCSARPARWCGSGRTGSPCAVWSGRPRGLAEQQIECLLLGCRADVGNGGRLTESSETINSLQDHRPSMVAVEAANAGPVTVSTAPFPIPLAWERQPLISQSVLVLMRRAADLSRGC